MRRILTLLAALVVAMVVRPAIAGYDEAPRTFLECIVQGGTLRFADEGISCRFVITESTRVYGTQTTESGEQRDVEIWADIRSGVVTYPSDVSRTVDLPPVPSVESCLVSQATATPVPCGEN